MTRRQKDPPRPLTQNARMRSQRADLLARAKALLAVVDGASFTAAAQGAGRCSGDAVARLVARSNWEGLAALESRHLCGPPPTYQSARQERILREFYRTPDQEQDATATCSLTTLQRALI